MSPGVTKQLLASITSAATGGTSLGTGASFTTPSISATTNYFVDATANGCTTATKHQ